MSIQKDRESRAAIDIGSNSIRLATSDGKVRSAITKLADGIEKTDALSPAGVSATIAALKEYADVCKRYDDVTVFATEAVRRAVDGADFCAAVKIETGMSVTVLSPEAEARLALAGAVKPSGAVTVCDLGGGSMELVSARDGKTPDYVKSLPLGVVVLKNRFAGDYRAAIDRIPAMLEDYGSVKDYPLVMSGGSACAIAAGMLKLTAYDKSAIDGAHFTARELDDCMPMFLSKKLSVLRPICAKRADTIPYGAIVVQALMNYIGVTEFYVSDSGNLDAAIRGLLPELA